MRPICSGATLRRNNAMLKVLGWIAAIILIVGLLVVFGVLKLIF